MSVSIGQDSTILYVVDEDLASDRFPVVKMIIKDSKGARLEIEKPSLLIEKYGDLFGVTAQLHFADTSLFSEGALEVQIVATDIDGKDYKTEPEYTLTTNCL